VAIRIPIDGPRLRALRNERSLSATEVARRAGFTRQTLLNGELHSRPMLDFNAEAAAKVLGCEVADFEAGRFDPSRPTGLERLVKRERSRGDGAPDESGMRRWNATALHEVSQAYEVHDTRSFLIRGTVESFRRASELEAAVLGAPRGLCTRALIAVPTRDGVTLNTTVHSLYSMHAGRLQTAMRDGLVVTGVVTVTVARVEDGWIVTEDTDARAALPADGSGWPGFEKLSPKVHEPWALRIEMIEEPRPPERSPRASGPSGKR
jgi:transcriptional regulator with XRE-family HTH domain